MIVVTGATGHVGGELVRLLTATGEPVRAMTRRPERARLPEGAEVVYGDADDATSLDAAFTDATGAFLMSAQEVTAAGGPTHDIALARAAARAGVRRVVKLSVLDAGAGGEPGHDPIARWHATAEKAVTSEDYAWTLLRPGRFMSNALQWAGMIRAADEVTVPFAHRPAASIDPRDIAAVAHAALTATGDQHAGSAHELSGPQSLTPAEELAVLGEVLGRDLRLTELPAEAARAGMLRHGYPPEVVDSILRRTLESDHGTEVLPTVERLLGRPPRTFAQWARAHVGAFR